MRQEIFLEGSQHLNTDIVFNCTFIQHLTGKDKVWREGICTRANWALCFNVSIWVLFFVPSSNLPPRLTRQGHFGRLCVFCLESFSRLFGDEVVVHKRATPGSGLQPWRWFITRHGGRRGLMTLPLCRAAWNQEDFSEHEPLCAAVSPSGDLFYCTGASFPY